MKVHYIPFPNITLLTYMHNNRSKLQSQPQQFDIKSISTIWSVLRGSSWATTVLLFTSEILCSFNAGVCSSPNLGWWLAIKLAASFDESNMHPTSLFTSQDLPQDSPCWATIRSNYLQSLGLAHPLPGHVTMADLMLQECSRDVMQHLCHTDCGSRMSHMFCKLRTHQRSAGRIIPADSYASRRCGCCVFPAVTVCAEDKCEFSIFGAGGWIHVEPS